MLTREAIEVLVHGDNQLPADVETWQIIDAALQLAVWIKDCGDLDEMNVVMMKVLTSYLVDIYVEHLA